MVLEGGFAVGGFDLVGGCGALEVEDLVGVDGWGIRVCDVFWRRHGVSWLFMACFGGFRKFKARWGRRNVPHDALRLWGSRLLTQYYQEVPCQRGNWFHTCQKDVKFTGRCQHVDALAFQEMACVSDPTWRADDSFIMASDESGWL